MHRSLVGGIVQRVFVGCVAGQEVAVLKVRLPPIGGAVHGENAAVVVAAGHGVGVLSADEAAGLRASMRGCPSPKQPVWRSRIEGARLEVVTSQGIEVIHAEVRTRAVAGRGGQLRLEDGRLDSSTVQTEDDRVQQGLRIVEALGAKGMNTARDQLGQALRAALARIERRIVAVTGDLERTATADAVADHARLFVAQASRVARGATEISATDWSTGEPRRVRMAIDPARGAEEQLEAVFKRARRLKEGARIARSRLDASESARAKLLAISTQLEAADAATVMDFEALALQAHTASPRDFRRQASSPASPPQRLAKQPALPPFRSFTAENGWRILVGRSGSHNDQLSFHVARPHDLWLHARSRAGAHVVVPLDRGTSCPSDLLIEAAHLAAHFSDARDEDVVEVEYTPRRYLRKPHGSEPGLVVVSREKVLVLRRSEVVLRRLLDREHER